VIRHPLLTEREDAVLRLACEGWSDDEIGARLHPPITRPTVRDHLESAYAKLGVASKAGATGVYARWLGRMDVAVTPSRRRARPQQEESLKLC
jgi:ATP/maltotriose-dependent transcriptional regulator MalT